MKSNQQALRDFRKRYKLTRKEAALELGYGFESWKAYETGTRVIPEHIIKSIGMYIFITSSIINKLSDKMTYKQLMQIES